MPRKSKATNKTYHKKKVTFNRKALRTQLHYLRPVSGVHMFKRTFSTIYAVTDTLANRANIHMLTNIPNSNEFTSLFDQYKIKAVKAKFIFDQNTSSCPNTLPTTNQTIPNLITVIDRDDGTPLSLITDYEQYESLKIQRLDRPVIRYFKPKLATAVYSGGTFSGYTQSPNVWVDANSPNVEYYGLKYGINASMEGGTGTKNVGAISIYWTYYIMLRDTR